MATAHAKNQDLEMTNTTLSFGGGVDCLAYGAHYTTSAAGMPNAIWTEAFSYSRHTVSWGL